MDLYSQVKDHGELLKDINNQMINLRGISMPEIIMIIERKKDEILSQIKENAY